jgi:putative hydrolase of the HAD superfamily
MKNISQIQRLLFDADDTLWENNIHYIQAAESFADLMAHLGYKKNEVEHEFQILEKKVVEENGYGSENYVLILRTLFEQYRPENINDQITEKFEKICSDFESHLHIPPRVFSEVPSILEILGKHYPLYVLTKGNIEEQKQKLTNSSLLKFFQQTFVVTEKDISTYRQLLDKNNWKANEVCMIGNSPRSDINPALKCGMCAVMIPYKYTWVLEDEPLDSNPDRLTILESFSDLPNLFIDE